MVAFNYIKDPKDIYQASFQAIDQHYDWQTLPDHLCPIAKRMAHSVGSTDFLALLKWRHNPVKSGIDALSAGKPLLVDSRMLKAGILQKYLPYKDQLICTLDHMEESSGAVYQCVQTRSMRAIDCSKSKLSGCILAIGNAPTALFRLLEGILNESWEHPALVIGF
ncbi:MAG: precorrin-8X methylmutase, partial [Pseudomonadota bacterium]